MGSRCAGSRAKARCGFALARGRLRRRAWLRRPPRGFSRGVRLPRRGRVEFRARFGALGRGAPPAHCAPLLGSGTEAGCLDLVFHLRAEVGVRFPGRVEEPDRCGDSLEPSAAARGIAQRRRRRLRELLFRGGDCAWWHQALGLVAEPREWHFAPSRGGASHALGTALVTRCVFGAGPGRWLLGTRRSLLEARGRGAGL